MDFITTLAVIFIFYFLALLVFLHFYRSFKASKIMRLYREALDLIKREDYGRAIELFNRVLMEDEEIKEAWMNKGVALAKLGKYDEAVISLREAIRRDENYEEAWMNLARVLVEAGRIEEAIEAYEKLKSLGDSEKWALEEGIALYRAGRFEDALKILSGIDEHEAKIYCALSLSKLGRDDEAIEIYRKLLEENPDDSIALNNFVALCIKKEKLREASEFLRSLERRHPSFELRRRLGEIFLLSGDLEESLRIFEEILKENPEDRDLLYNASLCYFLNGRHEDARKLIDRVIEQNPYEGDAWLLRGRIHDALGNEKGARFSVMKAIQLDDKLRKIVERDEKLSKYLS
ncbi:MAG: hypothetical protein PWR13_585 [Archaeoglobi archaeon]|nr:tetratricopeptide repeat protein [Candidatus Mnemosynella bozhongmuii]MDI3503019.1 hypothetical protein [Archaeoglobi archaeon]MDK2781557.1 hypothetical protein [Archaeoglobi archaeon]